MLAMKAILVIFSLINLTTFVVSKSEHVVPGVPVLRRSTRQLVSLAAATCTGTFGPKCKDCSTLMNCLGSNQPLSSVNCAKKDPKTPYCVGHSCSATPNNADPTCKDHLKTDFRCTGEGYFPDPDKCTRYYICPEVDQEAVAYDCPTNYVYKSKLRGCAQKLNALDCTTVNCTKTPNEFGVYNTDPAYYYFCYSAQNEKKTFVMKCLDEVNGQYDEKLGECSFRCTKEGLFVDVLNCTRYYNCFKVGSALQVTRGQCPSSYSFDRLGQKCVKKSCTPEVTPPTTAPPPPPTVPPSNPLL